ncbi:MAG: ribose 5-phosphate isomerase B [Clostridia bacterium]|nr:ribose 5-phosphate isomerase B [Clostridia bacterium]
MIAIGCDHAGFEMKKLVMEYLDQIGEEYQDKGFLVFDKNDDYPVAAKAVGRAVSKGEADRGILICGTGIGMSLCANKFRGVRAVVASDVFSVRYSRMHNDANVICFGARVMGIGLIKELLNVFLSQPFEGGRHAERVKEFDRILDEN